MMLGAIRTGDRVVFRLPIFLAGLSFCYRVNYKVSSVVYENKKYEVFEFSKTER